jgi:ribonuclease Y
MTDGIFWLILGGAMSGGVTFFITNKLRLSALSIKEASHKELLQNTILELQAQSKEVLSSLHEREQFVREQEVALTERQTRLGEREVALEANKKRLATLEEQIEQTLTSTQNKREELVAELSRIAEISPEDARKKMLKDLEVMLEGDMLGLFAKQKKDVDLRASEYAREILIKSIGQYAAEVTAETTQTIIHLESDDIKGKLIGKEGRNIIAFERATGVSLIIDDTPDTVFISSFDLFRRYIAKKSLEALILDKRIQPARIEEIVLQNQTDADKLIYELGVKTVQEMEITGIPDEILPLI